MNNSSDIWAVTTYFNPVKYKRRLMNYQLFKYRLDIPLLTIELSTDHSFDLSEGDADILLKISEGDVMWQKERLFNLALNHLPQHVSKIIWMDADIVFPDAGWSERVSLALEKSPVVQPFSFVRHMTPEDTSNEKMKNGNGLYKKAKAHEIGVAHLWKNGQPTRFGRQKYLTTQDYRYSAAGIAWATTRKFITDYGFFDECIVGSGDSAFWAGISGDTDYFVSTSRNQRVVDSWEDWKSPASVLTATDIGYTEDWVLNLWHGNYRNRQYGTRWEILRKHDFDPKNDLRISDQGAWVWNTEKYDLHREVYDYFKSRNEDEFVAEDIDAKIL